MKEDQTLMIWKALAEQSELLSKMQTAVSLNASQQRMTSSALTGLLRGLQCVLSPTQCSCLAQAMQEQMEKDFQVYGEHSTGEQDEKTALLAAFYLSVLRRPGA